MAIAVTRLVPGELANDIKWNNNADVMEELQDESLVSAWTTVTYQTGWRTNPAFSTQPLEVRYTKTIAFMQGVIENTVAKAAGTIISVLPLVVRPVKQTQITIYRYIAQDNTPPQVCNIYPNGNFDMPPAVAINTTYFVGTVMWSLG